MGTLKSRSYTALAPGRRRKRLRHEAEISSSSHHLTFAPVLYCLLIFLRPTDSFILKQFQGGPIPGRGKEACIRLSTIPLFGIRNSIRNKISFLKRRDERTDRNTNLILGEAEYDSATSNAAKKRDLSIISAESQSSKTPDNSVQLSATTTMQSSAMLIDAITTELPNGTVSLLKPASELLYHEESLYEMVSVEGRTLTQWEQEFRDMLAYFSGIAPRDLQVLDSQSRVLFEGVAASANEYAVYRAFEVLYQDILPLRVAGRLIFERLRKILQEAMDGRDKQVQAVLRQTGLEKETTQDVWYRFTNVARNLNPSSRQKQAYFLTKAQLATSSLRSISTAVIGIEVDSLLEYFPDDRVDFVSLLVGLQSCVEDLCGIEQCDPTAVLYHVTQELEHLESNSEESSLSSRKQVYAQKYDEMVESFIGWKDRVPSLDGDRQTSRNRRLEIVRGCFVGAENPKVVDALRIVYVDYSALRVCGDLIFGIVSSIMNKR